MKRARKLWKSLSKMMMMTIRRWRFMTFVCTFEFIIKYLFALIAALINFRHTACEKNVFNRVPEFAAEPFYRCISHSEFRYVHIQWNWFITVRKKLFNFRLNHYVSREFRDVEYHRTLQSASMCSKYEIEIFPKSSNYRKFRLYSLHRQCLQWPAISCLPLMDSSWKAGLDVSGWNGCHCSVLRALSSAAGWGSFKYSYIICRTSLEKSLKYLFFIKS